MIIKYTQEEFDNAKYFDKLPLKCKHCDKTFYKIKKYIVTVINNTANGTYDFCSPKCARVFNDPPIFVNCTNCNKKFKKVKFEIKKSKNHFCGHSCAATYGNTHRTTGTRRSKLEKWLEEQLKILYPNIKIDFNKKDAISSELDIYIPSLKLAFEINGIFHYEPIYGQDKLDKINNNDNRKFAACYENKIELCVIDTSQHKYVKPSTSQKYLDIIISILDKRLE